VLDEEGARLLDEASGTTRSGASRFFYCAKASRAERNAGLDDLAAREKEARYGDTFERGRNVTTGERLERMERTTKNHHPTVKPLKLMRWLVRLVTPVHGVILDPFCGSGSTGCAAVLEDFGFIGIDEKKSYVRIARARIHHHIKQL
jgi:site-specific DNA-methyltransferase (adenine-specific)